MQLVLGVRTGAEAFATPEAAAPQAPEPWLNGERIRRALRRCAFTAAFSGIVALGVVQGARVAIGAEGVSALARGEEQPASEGTLEPDPLHGTLWRPAGSTAERPADKVRPRRWQPEER